MKRQKSDFYRRCKTKLNTRSKYLSIYIKFLTDNLKTNIQHNVQTFFCSDINLLGSPINGNKSFPLIFHYLQ